MLDPSPSAPWQCNTNPQCHKSAVRHSCNTSGRFRPAHVHVLASPCHHSNRLRGEFCPGGGLYLRWLISIGAVHAFSQGRRKTTISLQQSSSNSPNPCAGFNAHYSRAIQDCALIQMARIWKALLGLLQCYPKKGKSFPACSSVASLPVPSQVTTVLVMNYSCAFLSFMVLFWNLQR